MGDKSLIEWTDATWNPVSGCSKVSQGCKFCYAERLFPRPYPGRKFTDVRTHADRLEQPLRWARPRRIFVNSMSDLFHEDVPFEFIDKVFAVMNRARQHTYQVLTKRPVRMFEYLTDPDRVARIVVASHSVECCAVEWIARWPIPHVWLGVSAEDQATFDERWLLFGGEYFADWNVFLSAEPLLGPIDIRAALPNPLWNNMPSWRGGQLGWVIAGGESGPKARPMHPAWARNVRDQCAAAGVPFFFKQWGEFAPGFNDGTRALDDPCMTRVGKKAAGRMLDGRTWDDFPGTSQQPLVNP